MDILHSQGVEDLDSVCPPDGVGGVVIAGHQHYWDACLGKASNSSCEFPLVGGRWIAALVGITGEDGQVHLLSQAPLHDPVEGSQEVRQSYGEPCLRVPAPVAFHSQVYVGEVKEFDHGSDGWSPNRFLRYLILGISVGSTS